MTAVKVSGESFRFSMEPAVDLASIEKLWRELDSGGPHSFFASWTWLGTWLRLIPRDLTPMLLRAEKGGETIAAAFLIPRQERRGLGPVRQLHFNSTGEKEFDSLTVEYTGFAGLGSNDPPLWSDFFDWFSEYTGADEVIVPGVADETIARMVTTPRLLGSHRNVPAFRVCGLSSMIEGGVEARLSRNSRQQLRRSMRLYDKSGPLSVKQANTVEEAQAYFTALRDLHILSWTERDKPHAFRYPFFETFHRALIAAGLQDGSVQLLRIASGDYVIGYLYNFRRGKRIYAYQSGFDSRKGLRPGYVCHALAVEYNAENGAEVYDFLAGDNRLKQSFANSRYFMSWRRYCHRNLRFRAEMLARSAARRVMRVINP